MFYACNIVLRPVEVVNALALRLANFKGLIRTVDKVVDFVQAEKLLVLISLLP